jgi:hypothetical protein
MSAPSTLWGFFVVLFAADALVADDGSGRADYRPEGDMAPGTTEAMIEEEKRTPTHKISNGTTQ